MSARTLWQSVLLTAVHDALRPLLPTCSVEARVDQRRADAWIRRGDADFKLVCTLAGFDPSFLRGAYLAGRIDFEALQASDRTRENRDAAKARRAKGAA